METTQTFDIVLHLFFGTLFFEGLHGHHAFLYQSLLTAIAI